MRKKFKVCWAVAGVLSLLICSSTAVAISISGVGIHANPSGSNEGLSGICYAGGTQFYAVDDSGGVMQPATISINPSSGAITAASFDSAVTLGGSDLEGIDYNAVNNSLLVSDETGATIKEYTIAGSLLSSVTVPSIFASYRANYSLESLTIRGDGLEMWTCNEEALYDTSPVVDDGPLSTDSNGSVVRLQRFVRGSVYDTWIANGQWAYLTDSIEEPLITSGSERSGVSDLCVLPDGTLLVLERKLGAGGLYPTFENHIYEVNFTGATDVSAITSLSGATYTRVTKINRWSKDFGMDYNFEGLCLGPRLDGDALSLIMIADGDGDQDNGLYALKLTGLTTRQLTVNTPTYGTANPVGAPYRYVMGTTVTNTFVGSPFLQDGYRYEFTGWTATGHTPSSGSGTTAILTLSADVQLTWNWQQISPTTNTIPYAETFESYNEGFQMAGVNGWAAESITSALVTTNSTLTSSLNTYGETCGYPVLSASHANVLEVNEVVTNSFDINTNKIVWVDLMSLPYHGVPDDTTILENVQVAVGVNLDDHPVVWYYDLAAGVSRWAVVDDITIADGEWVRFTYMLDYQTDDLINRVRYFQVRVNGNLVTNALAWTANDGSGSAGGSWFAMSWEPDYLQRFIYSPDGDNVGLDDLVVTMDNPLARDVEIFSAHGQSDPESGTYSYTYGDTVNLSLTNSILEQGTNQFVYTGWNMDGSAPASGTDTSMQITLTNDLMLTWLWATNNAQTSQGTPVWWLESYGLTAGSDDEDTDHDGMPTWQEWTSDTAPNDSNSVLKITDIVQDGSGMRVYWQGGVQATQILEQRTNLVFGADWKPVFTNHSPTLVTNDLIDLGATNSAGFYRLKVTR
jgi:hypothetical protein